MTNSQVKQTVVYVLVNWIWNFHTTDKMWDSLSLSWCFWFHFELIESKFNLWIVQFFYLLISVSQWNGPKQWIVNIINAFVWQNGINECYVMKKW